MSKYDFELDLYNENTLSIIMQMITKDSTVLEFGPANGRLTKYLRETLNCTIDIVEINEDSGKKAKKYSRNALLGNEDGDIEKYRWLEKYQGRKYDYIIFADVLEHLKNPAEVLTKVRLLLNKNGFVLLSVPNMAHNAILLNLLNNDLPYKELGLLDNTHIHFFAYQSLKDMIQHCGYYTVEENATYCRVKNTEFDVSYDNVSMAARKELRAKKYGNVYQFVFKISNNDYLDNKEEIRTKNLDQYMDYELVCYYKNKGANDYSEERCKRVYFVPGDNVFSVDLSNCGQITELRIDPIDCNCIVKDFMVIEDETGKELKAYGCNGIQTDDKYIFDTEDPMIYLDISEKKVNKITISFKVIEYENPAIKYLYDYVKNNIENNKQLKQVETSLQNAENEVLRLSKENEKNTIELKEKILELSEQNKKLEQEIEKVNSSKLWKLIKWNQ